ncbi:hypothetical protein H696_04117 [Fonticula alba]|uniref:Uncharacterized protein n=1 Tax=Fonticula alba TaxID=691883 RepID=A0A058Z613_FONAL|nr:hypothetical protein H696_04117 [Fonticula alba]KCV69710.1 hypothetical protein H696_04117 [Fonticula alba]|eukprot:XP_009496275.1 hypothetical protein H696_04117 [Fonticula alba]
MGLIRPYKPSKEERAERSKLEEIVVHRSASGSQELSNSLFKATVVNSISLVTQIFNTGIASKYQIIFCDSFVVATAPTYEQILQDWNTIQGIDILSFPPDRRVSATLNALAALQQQQARGLRLSTQTPPPGAAAFPSPRASESGSSAELPILPGTPPPSVLAAASATSRGKPPLPDVAGDRETSLLSLWRADTTPSGLSGSLSNLHGGGPDASGESVARMRSHSQGSQATGGSRSGLALDRQHCPSDGDERDAEIRPPLPAVPGASTPTGRRVSTPPPAPSPPAPPVPPHPASLTPALSDASGSGSPPVDPDPPGGDVLSLTDGLPSNPDPEVVLPQADDDADLGELHIPPGSPPDLGISALSGGVACSASGGSNASSTSMAAVSSAPRVLPAPAPAPAPSTQSPSPSPSGLPPAGAASHPAPAAATGDASSPSDLTTVDPPPSLSSLPLPASGPRRPALAGSAARPGPATPPARPHSMPPSRLAHPAGDDFLSLINPLALPVFYSSGPPALASPPGSPSLPGGPPAGLSPPGTAPATATTATSASAAATSDAATAAGAATGAANAADHATTSTSHAAGAGAGAATDAGATAAESTPSGSPKLSVWQWASVLVTRPNLLFTPGGLAAVPELLAGRPPESGPVEQAAEHSTPTSQAGSRAASRPASRSPSFLFLSPSQQQLRMGAGSADGFELASLDASATGGAANPEDGPLAPLSPMLGAGDALRRSRRGSAASGLDALSSDPLAGTGRPAGGSHTSLVADNLPMSQARLMRPEEVEAAVGDVLQRMGFHFADSRLLLLSQALDTLIVLLATVSLVLALLVSASM